MKRVLINTVCDLDPKVKIIGKIMFFLVNSTPP